MGIHAAFDLLAVAAALLVFRWLKLPAASARSTPMMVRRCSTAKLTAP